MAIHPSCDICGKELQDFGAILLSPPKKGTVDKFHICTSCYDSLKPQLQRGKTEAKITTDKPKS